jgi:hypothetical protein
MKVQFPDFAGLVLVIAFAIVLPILSGAEIERRLGPIVYIHPAIIA